MSRSTVEFPALPVGWSQITGSGIHLFLDRPSDDPLVAQLRETLPPDRDPGPDLLDRLLDVLLCAGIRGLPDFVAFDEVDPGRLVVRGAVVAEVTIDDEVRQIVAGGARTWADVEVSGNVGHVSLRIPSPEPGPTVEEAEPAPASGIHAFPFWPDELPNVPAGTSSAPRPTATQPTASRAGQEPVPSVAPLLDSPYAADDHAVLISYDDLFGSTQRAMAFHVEDQPVIPPPPVASDLTLPAPAEDSAVALGVGPGPRLPAGSGAKLPPPPTARGPKLPSLISTVISAVPWAKPSAGEPPAPAVLAAKSVPRPGSGAHSVPPAGVLHGFSPPPTRVMPRPPAFPAPEHSPMGGQPALPAYAPARNPGADDEDDVAATVDRSALLAAAPSPPAGPTVLAVLCSAGHPSPPHASRCRLCNGEIPSQEPYSTARPELGILRLSTGDVVSLDRGVLLGRAPKVDGDPTGSERPHVLRLASPDNDISRNHVEILLEGWHVMVRDLGSTNGTTVALPGQQPMRLHPNDQQVIEPGTIVTLADEVSFTFEVEA